MKLEYKWSDQQLTFLMLMRVMISLAGTRRKVCWQPTQAERRPSSARAAVVSAGACGDAFRAVLLDEKIDPALAAET